MLPILDPIDKIRYGFAVTLYKLYETTNDTNTILLTLASMDNWLHQLNESYGRPGEFIYSTEKVYCGPYKFHSYMWFRHEDDALLFKLKFGL